MKEKKKTNNSMLIAFILNFAFTIIEIIGGLLTNSISILSDAIHDFGDTISIGISLILEKISKKEANDKYTYGYARYSILGALINLCVLSVGTTVVLYNAIPRLLNPQQVNYDGMLILAVIGIIINGIGVLKTVTSNKISEKVISLHLLEDVLGWVAILVVSILMKIFNLPILDPILSILISLFILINVIKNAKKVFEVFLEKAPGGVDTNKIREEIKKEDGVIDIHHIHVWTMDTIVNYLTAHIVIAEDMKSEDIVELKNRIKHELEHFNIQHATLEIETNTEKCSNNKCDVKVDCSNNHLHQH